MLENQLIPTSRIGLSTIAESPIDWDIVYPGSEISFNLTLRETYEPRPHQVTAIDKTLAGFQIHDRGKLIMACGTGKTFTALRLLGGVWGGRVSMLDPFFQLLIGCRHIDGLQFFKGIPHIGDDLRLLCPLVIFWKDKGSSDDFIFFSFLQNTLIILLQLLCFCLECLLFT